MYVYMYVYIERERERERIDLMISIAERIAIAPIGTVTPRRFCERS